MNAGQSQPSHMVIFGDHWLECLGGGKTSLLLGTVSGCEGLVEEHDSISLPAEAIHKGWEADAVLGTRDRA